MVADVLRRLRETGCAVLLDGERLVLERPDPSPPGTQAALAVLREQREEARALLAEVAAHLRARCCRSPRAWVEADRLHADYTVHGGLLDRATYLAALLADGRAALTPGGTVAHVGLARDWPAEDGGTLRRARRVGGRRGR